MRFAITCAFCGSRYEKRTCDAARATAAGLNIYCNRRCSALGRSHNKTIAQKRTEKRDYDIEYRRKNRAMLKAKKAAYFQATYDPAAARIERKKRMPLHVEYCRRPEYRRWKSIYDRQYRGKKDYGDFADAAALCSDLNHEIKQRASNHEIKWQNGTCNKTQFRDRDTKEGPARNRSRPRFRERRDRHSSPVG